MTSIASPRDQPVTFVELFFDLVFVFSVTQVVALVVHDLTWAGAGRGLLVFWLVWWAWTQLTWALNAANTEHPTVELATLAATGIAFLMAVSLPHAFEGRGLWFALPYVLVRILGLTVYSAVARANHPDHHAAVRVFATVSIGGLVAALAGGIVGGALQYWLWGLAIVLDVVAAMVGGSAERWDLHPGHFAERHGLFVIIALGETLIVAASLVTDAEWSPALIGVAVLSVAVTCALWWSYFPGPRPALEHGLCSAEPAGQGALARDAFSLLHFPMMLGVIALAVGVEEAVLHPGEPLGTAGRLGLAASAPLFVGGAALAVARATGRFELSRIGIAVLTGGAVYLISDVPPAISLAVTFAGIVIVPFVERWPEHPGPSRGVIEDSA